MAATIYQLMFTLIKRLFFKFRYNRAIREAIRLHNASGLKYYVIYINGSVKVVPKQAIKQLIADHRFRKGVTIQDIERHALFITK